MKSFIEESKTARELISIIPKHPKTSAFIFIHRVVMRLAAFL